MFSIENSMIIVVILLFMISFLFVRFHHYCWLFHHIEHTTNGKQHQEQRASRTKEICMFFARKLRISFYRYWASKSLWTTFQEKFWPQIHSMPKQTIQRKQQDNRRNILLHTWRNKPSPSLYFKVLYPKHVHILLHLFSLPY